MARKVKNEIVMVYGATGKEVERIQKILQKTGSTIKVNGKYTVGMMSAVRAFQKKNGLEATGKIDTKTMEKLEICSKVVNRRKTVKK